MKNTNEKDWFDSPSIITYLIIGLLIVLIILSQSFAIQNHLGAGDVIRSILNHNSVYVLTLVYFVLLRTKPGKRYFDYLNVFMSIFYFLISIASLFTIFQSFGLASLISLILNVLLFCYFIYAFLCNTILGQELRLTNSPLVELKNNQYFYLISGCIGIDFVVALIDSSTFEGVVLILLEAIFHFLFARYIYLYKEYSDSKITPKELPEEKVADPKKKERKKKETPKEERAGEES